VNKNNENESLEKKITQEIQNNSALTKEMKKNPLIKEKKNPISREAR